MSYELINYNLDTPFMQKILEKAIFILVILTWMSHLVQVFTPEVGFDAVWYHLPVIKAILEQQKLVFIPDFYQSANPLLSDLIFGIGFFFAGELGSKIVAYLFGVALIVSSYILSRKFLNKFWSLVVVLIISTFQVVAWQSASFYVDVAKAFWEISSLVFLLKWQDDRQQKWFIISALLLGASLPKTWAGTMLGKPTIAAVPKAVLLMNFRLCISDFFNY
jgi:hypothetical protein